MEIMRVTMPAAYEQLLRAGQVNFDRLPWGGEQLRSFMCMTNEAAEDMDMPWNITMIPRRYGLHVALDVRPGGAALSQGDPRAALPRRNIRVRHSTRNLWAELVAAREAL